MSLVKDAMSDQAAINVWSSRLLAETLKPRPAWWPKPEIFYGPEPEPEGRKAIRELLAGGVTNPDEFLMALELRGFEVRDLNDRDDYDY